MTDEPNQSTDGVDLNDPDSWPRDVAGLAGLAGGERAADAKGPDKGAVALGADDGRGGPAAAGKDDAKAAAGAGSLEDGQKEDPKGVLTADGKHIIPYAVLTSERKGRQEAEAQLAALTAELETLKAAGAQGPGAQGGQGTETPAAANADDDVPQDVKDKVAQLREEYGDEFADNVLDTWRTKKQVAAVQAWMQTVKSERATAETATRQTQEQTIQEAIDSVPLLAQWQSDKDHPEWYAAANELHDVLLRTSAEYKAMNWSQRMAALPGKVEAVYGESPHSAKQRETKDNTKTAAELIAAAGIRRPASISDIPGGAAPAASEAEKLENMSPAQLQAHLNNVAARGSDAMQRFLSELS